MFRTLYRNARVRSPDDPEAAAMVVEGSTIVWIGRDPSRYAEDVDRIVDLAGCFVAPAFVDAHVHTTTSGQVQACVDLGSAI